MSHCFNSRTTPQHTSMTRSEQRSRQATECVGKRSRIEHRYHASQQRSGGADSEIVLLSMGRSCLLRATAPQSAVIVTHGHVAVICRHVITASRIRHCPPRLACVIRRPLSHQYQNNSEYRRWGRWHGEGDGEPRMVIRRDRHHSLNTLFGGLAVS